MTGRSFSPFITVNMSPHSLLAIMVIVVLNEKSAVNLTEDPLSVKSHFSPDAFLVFHNVTLMCLGGDLLISPIWSLRRFLDV